MRRVLFVLPLALLLGACERAQTPRESAAPLEPAARMWDRAGLEAQPRMGEYQRVMPSALGHKAGSSDWRELPLDDEIAELEAATPGRLLDRLALELGDVDLLGTDVWEMTLRILQSREDVAEGIILFWGFQDDAIAGRDLKVAMRLRGDLWRAEALQERFQCRRGVTGEGLCL
jgi:hypothetical protein